MSPNEQQQKIIEALDHTVNVSAGAGTGKTATLTNRVVRCISALVDRDLGAALPIENILAITFTKEAAQELKNRIRQALFLEAKRRNSPTIYECALNVDNAWISTIHSFAARILRENALDFDMDPDFAVLDEPNADRLFAQAFEIVLEKISNGEYGIDPGLGRFLSRKNLLNTENDKSAIEGCIKELSDSASIMPNGLSDTKFLDIKYRPSEVLRALYESALDVLNVYEEGKKPASAYKEGISNKEGIEKAIGLADRYFKQNKTDDFCDPDFDFEDFLSIVYAFPATSLSFPSSKHEYFNVFQDYRCALRRASDRTIAAFSFIQNRSIVELASMIEEEAEKLKSTKQTLLTNNDLLRICREKLLDENNYKILDRYKEQFQYIMIDEFQDTDKLQMEIVSMLAKQDEGCGQEGDLKNVCTVGDMQQSIYRFRGADVRLAKSRKKAAQQMDGAQLSLQVNYRSHRDILKAVEIVFSNGIMFGADFLKLEPSDTAELSPMLEKAYKDTPRAVFDFINYPSQGDITSAEAKAKSALSIAHYFKSLADRGVSYSDMVLLLGRMSDSKIYSLALDMLGIPHLVTGGSLFGESSEALLVGNLLRIAVNISDDRALFNVLTSDLFNVSDPAFAFIAKNAGIKDPVLSYFGKKFLSVDLEDATKCDYLNEEDVGQMRLTKRLLEDFLCEARRSGPAFALRRLLVDSGYIYRLEGGGSKELDAKSLSRAGNLKKALDIVFDLEQSASGIADICDGYIDHISTAKEPPGSLVLNESNFLSIMTIHSSKGLEFPHVAVADLEKSKNPPKRFIVENIADATYLSSSENIKDILKDDDTVKNYGRITKAEFGLAEDGGLCRSISGIDGIEDPDELYKALSSYQKEEELEERKRLLYVAMTRAKETLYVSNIKGADPTKRQNPYSGLCALLYESLCAYFGKEEGISDTDFDLVSMPIRFKRTFLTSNSITECERAELDEIAGINADPKPSPEAYGGDNDPETFRIPVYEHAVEKEFKPDDLIRWNVFSYTSLSKDKETTSSSADASEAALGQDEGRMAVSDEEKATSLGSAFHSLAELAICRHNLYLAEGSARAVRELVSSKDIKAKERFYKLSGPQCERLDEAVRRWLGSSIAKSFFSKKDIGSEVPFMTKISFNAEEIASNLSRKHPEFPHGSPNMQHRFYLEGEIDGLASCGGHALLIDYKTGRSGGLDEKGLYEKYLFQAQCYAYAMLRGPYSSVDANFILVEQEDPSLGQEPRCVRYSFSTCDLSALKDAILKAYARRMVKLRFSER